MTVALTALLAVNAVYFAVIGSTSKALDAAAWLALLILFELETAFPHWLLSAPRRVALRVARLAATAAVIAAAVAYVLERNVLDALNSILWIAVVVLLETELRWPRVVARARAAFAATAILLYGSLALLVLMWAARGEWFDAYDAALWLGAFVMVELDVMRGARNQAP